MARAGHKLGEMEIDRETVPLVLWLEYVCLPVNVTLCVFSVAPLENGDAEMAVEETWEQKGAEPSEAEPGGGSGEDEVPTDDSPQDEGMEDEEETPAPKVVPVPKDAPKKEHVNVVFIGHVGECGARRLQKQHQVLCWGGVCFPPKIKFSLAFCVFQFQVPSVNFRPLLPLTENT